MESVLDIKNDIKKALKELGYKNICKEASHVFAYLELEKNRMCLRYSLCKVTDGYVIEGDATFISNELGMAINRLTGKRNRVFPCRSNAGVLKRERVEFESIFNKVMNFSKDAVEATRIGDFKEDMAALLSRIDIPGSHQEWYVAGLASTADKQRLNSLLSSIEEKGRGGLYPYIKKEFIQSAMEYAESISNA